MKKELKKLNKCLKEQDKHFKVIKFTWEKHSYLVRYIRDNKSFNVLYVHYLSENNLHSEGWHAEPEDLNYRLDNLKILSKAIKGVNHWEKKWLKY